MSTPTTPRAAALLPAGVNQEDLQRKIDLLRIGVFYFDRRPREITWHAAHALTDAGLLRKWETGSDEGQYTCLNFEITERGKAALAAWGDVQ